MRRLQTHSVRLRHLQEVFTVALMLEKLPNYDSTLPQTCFSGSKKSVLYFKDFDTFFDGRVLHPSPRLCGVFSSYPIDFFSTPHEFSTVLGSGRTNRMNRGAWGHLLVSSLRLLMMNFCFVWCRV